MNLINPTLLSVVLLAASVATMADDAAISVNATTTDASAPAHAHRAGKASPQHERFAQLKVAKDIKPGKHGSHATKSAPQAAAAAASAQAEAGGSEK